MALGPVMINGYLADGNSAEIRIGGNVYYGITKVDFDIGIDSKDVTQIGTTTPVGGTIGSGKFALTISMVYDYWNDLQADLGDNFMLKRMNVLINQKPLEATGSNLFSTRKMTTVTMQNCNITGMKSGLAAGGEAQMVDLTFSVRGAVVNGVAPFPGADSTKPIRS